MSNDSRKSLSPAALGAAALINSVETVCSAPRSRSGVRYSRCINTRWISWRILDIGSRDVNGSYRDIFAKPPWRYLGVDLAPGKNVDVVLADAYDWREFPTDYADVIVSGQTLEHIEFFWDTLAEIARVMKPNGLCCLIAPSSGPEHRYPQDCWRIYPDGFAAVARYAFLEVIDARTQWDDLPDYDHENNQWHDSALIARKPVLPFLVRLRLAACSWLRRWLRPPTAPVETTIQVFPMIQGTHREEVSFFDRVPPGQWQECSIKLPLPTSTGPLRIDFISDRTVIDLSCVTVKGTSGKQYFQAKDPAAFARFAFAGDAERLPHAKYLRVRITGVDPQVVLPPFSDELTNEPLVLELRLFVHLDESLLDKSPVHVPLQ